jgi:hypothetical protein
MPYVNGVRVSNQEWQDRYSSLRKLHTGPNGDNPASDPIIDEATGAPVSELVGRSPRSAAAARAAIADALGVSEDSEAMSAIDVTGMDADSDDGSNPTDDGDQADDTASTSAADAEFACDVEGCDMVAKSALGLASHKRAKHKE